MSKASTIDKLYAEYWRHLTGRITPMFYQLQGKRATESGEPVPWHKTRELSACQHKIQNGVLPRGKLWFHMSALGRKK